MKSLTLLLIPLLFLSSCSIDWNDEKDEKIAELENKISTGATITLGSGFTLLQRDDETILSYSGNLIKTWSHTPPEKVPFIWDEACKILWEKFEKLAPSKQSTRKQGVWNELTEKEKKECIKEDYGKNITIEAISERFSEVKKLHYEGWASWIYDTKTRNLQELLTIGKLQIFETDSGITVTIDALYGDSNTKLTYASDFSKLLSREEILK